MPERALILLALVLVLPPALPGCKRRVERPSKIVPAKYSGKPFTLLKHGYSVMVPNGWEIRDQKEALVLMAPRDDDLDEFQESVSILVESVAADIQTNERYHEWGVDGMRNEFKGFRVLGSEPDVIGAVPAIAGIYEMNAQGKDLKVLRFLFLQGGKGYLITCSAEPDSFDMYKELFSGVAHTFQFVSK